MEDNSSVLSQSKLEEKLDLAIEEGQFEAAVDMSERLSQRDFASKLATAFDCHDYIKRKKVCSMSKQSLGCSNV